ncbi:hypothetical protein NGRA_0186 [Nosema granulosis]|uniref:Uncharacterized protein n=1 Tax=Nosema granulosis TaxID=83296 RepID=A0A9P6H0R8_9MICR|nr:hypothetical protein NGRA_0186 [Nosema granulosis]
MFSLVLNFPFKFKNEQCKYTFKTNIERKENLVSFAMELKYPIIIKGAACLSISYTNGLFVYVFKFEDINKAIDFMDNTEADVMKAIEFTNVEKLVEKTNKLMAEYEENEKSFKKKRKRRIVEDNDGFMKYSN